MKVLKNEKGSIAIIMALALTALVGFLAIVVDIGIAYVERIELANGLDAAALAAGLELMESEQKAYDTAVEFLTLHDIKPEEAQIVIDMAAKEVIIYGTRNVNHTFARVVGIDQTQVATSSKVIVGPVSAISDGLRPFAVELFDYDYGQQVVLKQGADSNYHGNFGAIALGGTGANTLRDNSLYGYLGNIAIGDVIETETGNMASVINAIRTYLSDDYSTFTNYDHSSKRLWTIPLVDTMDVNGRKSITVLGFAEFFIEGVRNTGGQAELTGRFIRYVKNGDVDQTLTETGLYGVQLIQ